MTKGGTALGSNGLGDGRYRVQYPDVCTTGCALNLYCTKEGYLLVEFLETEIENRRETPFLTAEFVELAMFMRGSQVFRLTSSRIN